MPMKCPLVFSSNLTGMGEQRFVFAECLKAECAWYEEYFGKCCMAVEAYVKGMIDHRAEAKQAMRDRD